MPWNVKSLNAYNENKCSSVFEFVGVKNSAQDICIQLCVAAVSVNNQTGSFFGAFISLFTFQDIFLAALSVLLIDCQGYQGKYILAHVKRRKKSVFTLLNSPFSYPSKSWLRIMFCTALRRRRTLSIIPTANNLILVEQSSLFCCFVASSEFDGRGWQFKMCAVSRRAIQIYIGAMWVPSKSQQTLSVSRPWPLLPMTLSLIDFILLIWIIFLPVLLFLVQMEISRPLRTIIQASMLLSFAAIKKDPSPSVGFIWPCMPDSSINAMTAQ